MSLIWGTVSADDLDGRLDLSSTDMAREEADSDGQRRRLMESVLFNRKFVSTYNIVLLFILLAFTLWNWTERARLRRRKMLINQTTSRDWYEDEPWSSSSSIIEGTTIPLDTSQKKIDKPDETTTSLPRQRAEHKSLGIWRPYYHFKAFIHHQPRPIPIVNKTLPTNGTSLLVLTYLAINAFYNFYGMTYDLQHLFGFADRCGLVFCANLPILYLLAAKNQPLKALTGYSYESLNIFHRRVGELLCLEAFLHSLGMVVVWYGVLRHNGFTFTHFIFNRVVLTGLGAYISYETLFFTSLRSFRQRMYEVFLALHIFFQIAALVFLWFHYPTSRIYVGISLAIFLVDRLLFRLWLKTSTHPATLTILPDEETVLVSANWDVAARSSSIVPKNMKAGWCPNDHVFLTIPELSQKHSLQAHPFTIFSAAHARTPGGQGTHAWFSLLIRAQHSSEDGAPGATGNGGSGFTSALLRHASYHSHTRIRLDGPYGSSHALQLLSSSETAIIVAGGSGIAVAYPLLCALLDPATSDVEAPYRFSRRKVKLIWIMRQMNHQHWIPSQKLVELQKWGLELDIPPPTMLAGRPKAMSIMENAVGDGRTGVVISGPDGLVRDVRNACASMMREGTNVKVRVEKFGW